ncbi:uncharacterized protein K02A2.6-like [Ornithodoros turicata]|uniref:uncharacterized protein K02A2.6-like n=1 Tax=Ornithodoros turicata TaxID=34597 RepID=UPI00313895F8
MAQSNFSKLDLNQGYHQLELSEESRAITTFSTHCGLRRYKRLLFWVNAAAEIFQDAIRQILPDEDGIINVTDDILVSGRTVEEHDRRLRLVLKHLEEAGITLNEKKCVVGVRSVKFFGHVFAAGGVSVDPEKVEAVVEMSPPRDATEVRSLLGMLTYCTRFIPRLAEMVEPLTGLTHKDAEFIWTERHQKVFERIKQEMSQVRTLAYFDDSKETYIITDAGPDGVAGVLAQESNDKENLSILAYYSRALTSTKKRYPQIDKEMLAIVSTAERFRAYLAGAKFTIRTDHLPLVSILKTPSAKLSARLERLSLRLQHYLFDVQHIPGKENPADYLSRHPVPDRDDGPARDEVVDEYSRFRVVSTLSSLNAKTVTARLSDIFAVHGMPYDLKTDNGPPFFGKEFAEFLRLNGIRHHRTTPLWPHANGEVERFIRNVKKTVKAACVGGNDLKEELNEYLLNYRETPHSTTCVTPSELLFGRKIPVKLPQLRDKHSRREIESVDRRRKQKMKSYADEKHKAVAHSLRPGDTVLLRRPSPLAHESPYEPRPYKV